MMAQMLDDFSGKDYRAGLFDGIEHCARWHERQIKQCPMGHEAFHNSASHALREDAARVDWRKLFNTRLATGSDHGTPNYSGVASASFKKCWSVLLVGASGFAISGIWSALIATFIAFLVCHLNFGTRRFEQFSVVFAIAAILAISGLFQTFGSALVYATGR